MIFQHSEFLQALQVIPRLVQWRSWSLMTIMVYLSCQLDGIWNQLWGIPLARSCHGLLWKNWTTFWRQYRHKETRGGKNLFISVWLSQLPFFTDIDPSFFSHTMWTEDPGSSEFLQAFNTRLELLRYPAFVHWAAIFPGSYPLQCADSSVRVPKKKHVSQLSETPCRSLVYQFCSSWELWLIQWPCH